MKIRQLIMTKQLNNKQVLKICNLVLSSFETERSNKHVAGSQL